MVVLNFNIIYVILLLQSVQVVVLQESGNETATQEINEKNNATGRSDKQYEAKAITITNNNFLEYQTNKRKENGSSRRKRQAIIPNLLGLGTQLLSPPIINAQLSPGVSVPLSPEINAPLSSGVNAQLRPEINLDIDKDQPNSKEQNCCSETTNSVKNPLQVFIIYPKDIDKNSNDIKTEQIPFTVDNSNINDIIDALNPKNCENNKTDIATTHHKDDNFLKNNTHRSINNAAEKQILHSGTKSENPNDNETENLKNNESFGSFTPCDYNKNYNTANENIFIPDETDNKQHESRPVLSATEGKKKIPPNNYETQPIQKQIKYIPIEKVKLDSQNTNSNKNEETEHTLENFEANNDVKSIGLLHNEIGENTWSNNAPQVKYPYLSNCQYLYPEALPGNWRAYSNYLNHLYNDDRNACVQRSGKMKPAFNYPLEDQHKLTYQYQRTESTPNHIGQDRDSKLVYNVKGNDGIQEYSNVFKNPVEMWKHQEPETIPENYGLYNGNDFKYGYNQKRNYVLQDYRNIPSEFKYLLDTKYGQLKPYKKWSHANQKYVNVRPAFQYQNMNQYVRPENLTTYTMESNCNDIREKDINRNYDPSPISRNFELYYDNNNNGYGMVDLNTGMNAEPKRIPCRCNQQNSLITRNGFYENQSARIMYPTYYYYPYVYRNIPT